MVEPPDGWHECHSPVLVCFRFRDGDSQHSRHARGRASEPGPEPSSNGGQQFVGPVGCGPFARSQRRHAAQRRRSKNELIAAERSRSSLLSADRSELLNASGRYATSDLHPEHARGTTHGAGRRGARAVPTGFDNAAPSRGTRRGAVMTPLLPSRRRRARSRHGPAQAMAVPAM